MAAVSVRIDIALKRFLFIECVPCGMKSSCPYYILQLNVYIGSDTQPADPASSSSQDPSFAASWWLLNQDAICPTGFDGVKSKS
jgi:hypothetical protein